MDNNIIPMTETTKTDAQLIDELSAKNRKMRRLLNNSNELLRSAFSIAGRSGEHTFWEAFKNKVEEELKTQSDFFNEENSNVVIQKCTAKGCNEPSIGDYNGHGDYACEYHMKKWNDEFDEEYK